MILKRNKFLLLIRKEHFYSLKHDPQKVNKIMARLINVHLEIKYFGNFGNKDIRFLFL